MLKKYSIITRRSYNDKGCLVTNEDRTHGEFEMDLEECLNSGGAIKFVAKQDIKKELDL